MENKIQEESGVTLRELLGVIKKNVILLLVIVFLSTLVGIGYSRLQQPKYTAHEFVFFKAQNIDNSNTTDNISAMIAYVDTVADFCDEGVVVDRANHHYDEYLKKKNKGEIDNLNDYITWSTKNDTYQVTENGAKYFSKGNIGIKIAEKDSDGKKPFSFTVSYTDDSQELSYIKVRILIHSLKMESVALNSNFERKYFDGVNVEIMDEGLQGISVDISRTKTIFLFMILGVAIGLIAVYSIYLLDNTVKSREELERLTGTNIMAVIEEQGGER